MVAALATGWLGQIPALVGLVAGAVLAAAFEPRIVAFLQRVVSARPADTPPVTGAHSGGSRPGRRWLVALATAIASVLVVVTVIDAARGKSLVGDRDKTFLPGPSKPAEVVRVPVPPVVNRPFAWATGRLEGAGFEIDRRDEFDAGVTPESVIRTDPLAGTLLSTGSSVVVVVSGNSTFVPDVAETTFADAEARLREAGFTVERQDEFSVAVLTGIVTRTEPAAETRAETGSSLRVFVSGNDATVPEVGSLLLNDAKSRITAAGLVPATVPRVDPSMPIGRVILTDPAGGTRVEKGSSVTVALSAPDIGVGPPPVVGPGHNAPP